MYNEIKGLIFYKVVVNVIGTDKLDDFFHQNRKSFNIFFEYYFNVTQNPSNKVLVLNSTLNEDFIT